MARLNSLERGALPEEKRPVYDAIVRSRGAVQGPFTILIHSPDLAGRVAEVGSYVRFESALPPAVTCMAAIMVAREMDCEFEWAGWAPQARDAGVPDEVITAIQQRRAPASIPADLEVVYAFGRQLLSARHRVDQETYDTAISQFGVKGAVDLCSAFGYLAMLSFSLNAFEVDAPDGRPRLDENQE